MVTVQNNRYLYGCNVNNYTALLIVMSESFGDAIQIYVMSRVNLFDIYRSQRDLSHDKWRQVFKNEIMANLKESNFMNYDMNRSKLFSASRLPVRQTLRSVIFRNVGKFVLHSIPSHPWM
jgi:hypothetical protein